MTRPHPLLAHIALRITLGLALCASSACTGTQGPGTSKAGDTQDGTTESPSEPSTAKPDKPSDASSAKPSDASSAKPSDASSAKPSDASSAKPSDASVAKPDRPKGTPQPKLPVGTVVLETAPREPLSLKVEVASTDVQRQMGMMFRETLGEDEGMLFVFPTERLNNFWMRNTLIPLDMLFIDSEWQVVGIVENATPLTDDPRGVGKMSQYVLEVPGGFAARHGLGTDTQVRFTPPPGTTNP